VKYCIHVEGSLHSLLTSVKYFMALAADRIMALTMHEHGTKMRYRSICFRVWSKCYATAFLCQ